MQDIIQQLIHQIENNSKYTHSTKACYKSDLNELLEYVKRLDCSIRDINRDWIKSYLTYLEELHKERNSFNRKASTFRLFLKYLYLNKLTPSNFSLIVYTLGNIEKLNEDSLSQEEIIQIIENANLPLDHKLILVLLNKSGLDATEIVSLNSHQIDFENKCILLSDSEKVFLDFETFNLLRDYLINVRPKKEGADKFLKIFLNTAGRPLGETDIYTIVKDLSTSLNLEGKLTTRTIKKSRNQKRDILSIQKDFLKAISPGL